MHGRARRSAGHQQQPDLHDHGHVAGDAHLAAHEGRLWVDTTSKRVLRIEQFAVQMPRDFLFSQAETAVEYDWIEIGEKQYWLPISAENQIGSDRYDYHTRNIIKFYDYRKFEAEVKILD